MFHNSIGKLSCCYFMNQHAKAEQERKQREEDARNKMRPPSTDSEGSDDELDEELRRYCSFITLSFPIVYLCQMKCL